MSVGNMEDVVQRTPPRAKLPPLPAHLRSVLTHSSAKRGSHVTPPALPAGLVKKGPNLALTSCSEHREAQQSAHTLHAAILQQAAKLKPATPSLTPAVPTQAPKQASAALADLLLSFTGLPDVAVQ